MRRAALIVNPFASAVTEERIERVARTLRVATVVRTERRGHGVELARELSAEVDVLYVFSGDGGFNEVLNGCGPDTCLGFVPGGGTSVLPRALGLPRDPVRAAANLADALGARRMRRISLGRVNGRRFAFSAGVGLDAELVRRLDALGRSSSGRRPGDLAFLRTAARLVAERRGRWDPALEIEGRGRAAFALVANTDPYTYAGRVPLRVAPQARFELGLDLIAPVEIRAATLPRILRYVFLGRGQERAPDILYGHDVDAVEVVCDAPMPLQADGEDLGDVTRATFAAERRALDVLF